MKYLISMLLVFSAFMGSHQLLASEINENLEYYWSCVEDELALVIDKSKNTEFYDKYTAFKVKENGLGCRIICKPSEKGILISSEGHEIVQIELEVIVKNVEDPNIVNYQITKTTSYEGFKEEEWVSTISKFKMEGNLETPAIDLTERPIFFVEKDEPDTGYIIFKNLT